jgi:sugar/nucleoside kinase (ribokinase family)
MAFVTLSPEGERSFSFARKPGADTCLRMDECDLSLIQKAKVFHFGTLSLSHQPARDATRSAVALAKDCGKLITFDPNLRMPLWESAESAAEFMHWGLKQANAAKISDDEVRFLFGCGPEEGARIIREEYHTELVFVTCGAKGCYFAAEGGAGWVYAPKVTAVDTTGAGDIFFGAAVSRLLKLGKPLHKLTEKELIRAAAFGCTAASLSTQSNGGIPSIPSEEEVLANLQQ